MKNQDPMRFSNQLKMEILKQLKDLFLSTYSLFMKEITREEMGLYMQLL